jgi:Ca2+-binding RTX toxin-like protein
VAPAGAQAAAGDVYIADRNANLGAGDGGVLRIPAAGGDAVPFATSPDFVDPEGLAMLPDGRLLVGEQNGARAFIVDADGSVSTLVTTSDPGTPLQRVSDVVVNFDGSALIMDNLAEKVFRVNLATKQLTEVVDLTGANATAMTVARDGFLYFTAPTAVLRGRIGVAPTAFAGGDLANPVDLALSPDERTIYVADINAGVISVNRSTAATDVLFEDDGGFDFRGIAVRPDRNLLAADDANNIVAILSPSGAPLGPLSDFGPLDGLGKMTIEPPRCGGRVSTIVGSTGDDNLAATPFADVINALGGNDTVTGAAQNDLVCGDAGNDRLFGGARKDNLIGGAGNDLAVGGAGRDLLQGGAGRDKLKGGPGKDRLRGGPGRDILRGGPGRDRQKQ